MQYKLLQSLFLVLFLSGSFLAIAQPPKDRPGGKHIEALRIAYITEKLQLTAQEAQVFWPVYNEYQAKIKEARKQSRLDEINENSSDADIEKAATAYFDAETRVIALQKEYFAQLKKVLPLKKVAKLYKIEHEFRGRLLEHIGKGRGNNNDDDDMPPPPPPPRGRR